MPDRLSGLMKPPPSFQWRAWKGGPLHAYRSSGMFPALCGAPNIEPRFAWPTKDKCDVCVLEADLRVAEALRGPQLEAGL